MTDFLAELIGTFIVVLIGIGVAGGVILRGTKANGSGWLTISIGWGLAYMVGTYTVFAYSGAHLNPALTLGLAIIGQFSWSEVFVYISGQLLGAIFGAVVVYLFYLPHWKVTPEGSRKLNVFVTSPALRNTPANLLSELVGTFLFVLGILTIRTNSFSDGLHPIIIGLIVMAIGMSIGGTTGFAINPARDLGARIAHYLLPINKKGSSEWGYSWIPVLGPIIGGIYGALFYQSLFLGVFSSSFWIGSIVVFCIGIWAFLHDKMATQSVRN
ncbi:aquaporin family protein [Caldibacillus lycopersici]|uniref:Aquaporin family protein n=1 Tax=Perspicuibacillus lycopersici TaxID=1325689 RepID=A0AAE3ITM0_9BACI|nr:MIP/aquaporin family protein [Perspicuibacillus lycopersici]MCU9614266.1 aquaporin family protein [Perspicuibacillus lycopersici]